MNAIAPSWTATGLVPADRIKVLGVDVQDPGLVARSVVFLFTDTACYGDLIYSRAGKYYEINNSQGGLLPTATALLGNKTSEDEVYQEIS